MHDIGYKQYMGKTKEDKMEDPEAEDGYGSKYVKAHVRAARLDGVADKSLLLVTEEGETSQQEDEQT